MMKMICPKCGYSSFLLDNFHWENLNRGDIAARGVLYVTCPQCLHSDIVRIDENIGRLFPSWFIGKTDYKKRYK